MLDQPPRSSVTNVTSSFSPRRPAAALAALAVDHPDLAPGRLKERVDELLAVDAPRRRLLWHYYRNALRVRPADAQSPRCRPYRQAQEWGLPGRITGFAARHEPLSDAAPFDEIARKEVVIENDIGWRVDACVDFLFGKPITIRSTAADERKRAAIEAVLRGVFARHGGTQFLQQLATLGAVYGFVDVLVKPCDETAHRSGVVQTQTTLSPPAGDATPAHDAPGAVGPADDASPSTAVPAPATDAGEPSADHAAADASCCPEALACRVRFEIVDPARALPFLHPDDPSRLAAYGLAWAAEATGPTPLSDRAARLGAPSWTQRLLRLLAPRPELEPVRTRHADERTIVELHTAAAWQRYADGRLVAQGRHPLAATGELPIVHVQNIAVHGQYAGASDVEPLIPLQDELNTRLSDRATRVTMQSFKMYLGKGVENFDQMPVAPGRMWATDNEKAQIIEFGGDAQCPSEDAAIADLREAMDKTSGISPVAAGAIRNRIGRLTSAAALRVTLLSLLARTERKRLTYGAAVARLCELALAQLDAAGLFRTRPDERGIAIDWPNALPDIGTSAAD
jgi:hypothetical protein